jgi:hypothetical protein
MTSSEYSSRCSTHTYTYLCNSIFPESVFLKLSISVDELQRASAVIAGSNNGKFRGSAIFLVWETARPIQLFCFIILMRACRFSGWSSPTSALQRSSLKRRKLEKLGWCIRKLFATCTRELTFCHWAAVTVCQCGHILHNRRATKSSLSRWERMSKIGSVFGVSRVRKCRVLYWSSAQER